MVTVTLTPRFKKAYSGLADDVKTAVDGALKAFIENPRHPSLHFEKLSGSAYRTIRVDRKKWRIVLRGEGSAFEVVDIDRHQTVDRKYG